jgi:hypothetical protein
MDIHKNARLTLRRREDLVEYVARGAHLPERRNESTASRFAYMMASGGLEKPVGSAMACPPFESRERMGNLSSSFAKARLVPRALQGQSSP